MHYVVGCVRGRNLLATHSLGKGNPICSKSKTFRITAKSTSSKSRAPLPTVQNGLQAIATAYGDYGKKSFEDTKAFVEKLSGMKSLDKVVEAQTEFARSAYETFMADSQKIAGLYGDLAKQAVKPMEGLVAKFSPNAN